MQIFGWFLEPGKLYDLYRGEAHDRHVAAWPEEQKKAAGVQDGQQGQQGQQGQAQGQAQGQGPAKSGKRGRPGDGGHEERGKEAATVQAKEGVGRNGSGRGAEVAEGRKGGGEASAAGGSKQQQLQGPAAAVAREEELALGRAAKRRKCGAGDGVRASQPGDGSESAGRAGHRAGRGSEAAGDEGQAGGDGTARRQGSGQAGAGGCGNRCTAGGEEHGRSRCGGRSGGGRPRLPEAWQGRRRHWGLAVAPLGRGPGAGRAQGRPNAPRR